MSGTGSPADQVVNTDTNVNGGAPAGTPAEGTASASTSGDANSPAASSSDAGEQQGAKKDAPKPTLNDVIKTALTDQPDVQGNSPAPAKDGKEDAAAAAKGTENAEGVHDDANLPFHNHPRWKEVTGQNKQLKADIEAIKPDAEQFRNINTFMQENSLTPDEVGEGFIIMAMAKNGDPRVLQKLDDFRSKVALAIGEAVPSDIQAQIDSGEITEAAGKELAKARAHKAMSDKQLADRDEADKRTKEQRDAEALGIAQRSAVSAWEVEARKTDPDFAKKEKAIGRYARALMQEKGIPTTAEAAVDLIKAAYAEVNRDMETFIPPKQPVARVPSAPSSHGAKEAPKSLNDAVRLALSQ